MEGAYSELIEALRPWKLDICSDNIDVCRYGFSTNGVLEIYRLLLWWTPETNG